MFSDYAVTTSKKSEQLFTLPYYYLCIILRSRRYAKKGSGIRRRANLIPRV